ncbi:MAG: D-arabinose 5-phosphate isomerase [Deltaproteobacteria bacterium RIFCSPHIGHO2_12_FULL_43_9]|nr:MAG: D-arabinose 5-phosphate isomerase [Deltaproteobacteria bacterium RIFCSPHIGHO2_12_FULL_43_9]
MRDQDLIDNGRRVIKLEAEAVEGLLPKIDVSFVKAIKLIKSCEGRVVVTGTGKSGQIARKIAATLASTGTPAFFLHAVEGMHGDLGMIVSNDVVIALSNSGETEVTELLPILKRLGVSIIAMTGNKNSSLAKAADVVLDISVKEEACSMGLVPTSSTTATLAMGDALAVTLLKEQNFKEQDFALRHPGGTLGKRLLLTVDDLMHSGDMLPLVFPHTSMREAIVEITSKRLGVTGVIDGNGALVGIITDGDLRRGLEKRQNLLDLTAADILTKEPKTIYAGELAEKGLQIMESFKITSLFVVKKEFPKKPVGILHLHDLLKAKII